MQEVSNETDLLDLSHSSRVALIAAPAERTRGESDPCILRAGG
jgi:hypothetical protein